MPRLRFSRPLVFCLLALTFCALMTGVASARSTAYVSPVADCQAHQGTLTRTYTSKELQQALAALPSSTKEYTTCYGVLQAQLQQQLQTGGKEINSGDTSGSKSGGSGSGTVIIIVVIVVVLVIGGGGAFYAYRRNQAAGDDPRD